MADNYRFFGWTTIYFFGWNMTRLFEICILVTKSHSWYLLYHWKQYYTFTLIDDLRQYYTFTLIDDLKQYYTFTLIDDLKQYYTFKLIDTIARHCPVSSKLLLCCFVQLINLLWNRIYVNFATVILYLLDSCTSASDWEKNSLQPQRGLNL